MKEYPSIFTQVLGPIGPGPSSSSTCGMLRTAYLSYQVFGSIPQKATARLPKDGVFPPTWFGMRSDLAVINGLLGKGTDDLDFMNAYANARQVGMEFNYEFVTWPEYSTVESNTQLYGLNLSDKDGLEMFIVADSTGGGTCLIREIDGLRVSIKGDQYELLLFFDKPLLNNTVKKISAACREVSNQINEINYSEGKGGKSLIEIKSGEAVSYSDISSSVPASIRFSRMIKPVHAVIFSKNSVPPFETAEQMIVYCEKEKIPLWKAAVKYEIALSGWSEGEVLAYAAELYDRICQSTDIGLGGNFDMNGIISPTAHVVKHRVNDHKLPPLGILGEAMAASLAVMENSNSSGTIVYLPTGGSSGIIPGVLRGLRTAYNANREDLAKALLVSGIIGVCMAEDNNFSGVQYGCQAEIACATAMASGAIIHFTEGTASQACKAASMCLQSMLGLICDTVAGMVQVPCLARNITGTAIAFAAAQSVMAGFDPIIPLSDMTWALRETGKKIVKFGIFGACSSCTGNRLAVDQAKREEKIRQ